MLLLLFLLHFLPPCALPGDAPGQTPPVREKMRVLLLGDSISIGYTPIVQTLLKDEAVVLRPVTGEGKPENCAGTTQGLQALDRWLQIEGGHWDVIHFNFGLHDLKRVDPKTGEPSNNPSHPRQAGPGRYQKQLTQIVRKLKATGASLVFATTTPVPAGPVQPYRDAEDAGRYNQIALQIMREFGIRVNDLYAAVQPRLKELQRPANVHFTKEGSEFLAGEVVRHIRAARGRQGHGP